MENQFNWKDLKEKPKTAFEKLLPEKEKQDWQGCFLETNLGKYDSDPGCFLIYSYDNITNSKNNDIFFFEDIENDDPVLAFQFSGDINLAKEIIEKTFKYFSDKTTGVLFQDVDKYINKQIKKYEPLIVNEYIKRECKTAQKTGYVQGVCESVLAFNTDENRKIMSEATMSFLSKKMLSEMNVTKDMAQKFANPETYKALEKCVFAPAQEQQLEQTQTQGRGR